MKKLLILSTILLTYCSTADLYGDIDLGGNVYFIVDPSFNSVDFATGPTNDPMRTALPIISNIESVGFNDTCILVVSKTADKLKYWTIDKRLETKLLNTPGDSISKISNLKTLSDSSEFNKLKSQTKIELVSKTVYRKQFNYE